MLQEDLSLADTIIASSGLKIGGAPGLGEVWDVRGNLYRVPQFCWQTPSNVAPDEVVAARGPRVKPHSGPVMPLSVTLRLSPSRSSDEQDVSMTLKSSDTPVDIRMRLHEFLLSGSVDGVASCRNKWKGVGLPPTQQTIVFAGNVLTDAQHLQGAGVGEGGILQVFVRRPRDAPPVVPVGASASASSAAARR
jgi:hypothetical protein